MHGSILKRKACNIHKWATAILACLVRMHLSPSLSMQYVYKSQVNSSKGGDDI